MSNSMSTIVSAVVMFGAVTAGAYAARVIPGPSAGAPAAVTTPAPAAATDSKTADQPVNEQNGQLMPGLTASDYFNAGMACDAYGSGATALTAQQKTARDVRSAMYAAAVKAVGVDPETCKKN